MPVPHNDVTFAQVCLHSGTPEQSHRSKDLHGWRLTIFLNDVVVLFPRKFFCNSQSDGGCYLNKRIDFFTFFFFYFFEASNQLNSLKFVKTAWKKNIQSSPDTQKSLCC